MLLSDGWLPAAGSSPVRPVSMAEVALVDATLFIYLCMYTRLLEELTSRFKVFSQNENKFSGLYFEPAFYFSELLHSFLYTNSF